MPVKVEKLEIVHYPDPVLRAVARNVERVNDEVRAVAARMIELMHEAKGVGLAAPQVGLAWRMFVANPSHEPGDDRVFINPVLDEASEKSEASEEGCLSIPDVRGQVRRPASISVHATDEEGRAFSLSGEGLAARVWQHETDHLNGVLILDRMSPLDKIANRRKIKDLEAEFDG